MAQQGMDPLLLTYSDAGYKNQGEASVAIYRWKILGILGGKIYQISNCYQAYQISKTGRHMITRYSR